MIMNEMMNTSLREVQLMEKERRSKEDLTSIRNVSFEKPKMALISLHPPEILSFSLLKDKSAQVVLRLTNISTTKVAFKVKTTQPSWYYVRPNQHILDVNQSEEVVIQLLSTECSRLLELNEVERESLLSNHRFLIQSKVLNEDVFTRIQKLPLNSRTEEFQRIWESTSRDALKNQKLKVAFDTSDLDSNQEGESQQASQTISENVESLKAKLSQYEEEIIPLSQRVDLVNNLQNLQKKYNQVIEFVVKLTAERDEHLAQYETLRKEYLKLVSGTNDSNEDRLADIMKQSKLMKKKKNEKIVQSGFSFLALVIISAFTFILTRYLQARYSPVEE